MSEGNMQPEQEQQFPRGRENLVVLSKVDNKVLEVNTNVFMPLKLEKGKPSPMGLFVEAMLRDESDTSLEGKFREEFWSSHHRSMLLGKAFFEDNEGRLYRDIDIKGMGFLAIQGAYRGAKPAILVPGKTRYAEAFLAGVSPHGGLLDRDVAFYDYCVAEEFTQAGIRTHRGLAIIELRELIVNGRRKSVNELKKYGLIDKDFYPVIEVRAFGTKARISDRTPEQLEDAKRLVAQELGIEFNSDEEYFKWFAQELGRNVGLMHKNGWLYTNWTDQNITLDCRIVDLDSVEALTDEKHRQEDTREAASIVFRLSPNKELHVSEWMSDPLVRLFHRGYNSIFPPQERKEKFSISTSAA